MEFNIDKSVLVKVLGQLSQSVSKKATDMPILEHVIFKAAPDGSLELMATDLAQAMVVKNITAEVVSSGSFGIKTDRLSEIVGLLNDKDNVSFKTTDSNVEITSGKAYFELPLMASDTFPDINLMFDFKPIVNFTTSVQNLKGLVNSTSHCVAAEDSKGVFTGILFDFITNDDGNQFVRFVSSDGFGRISIAQISSTFDMSGEIASDIVSPVKPLKKLGSIFGSNQQIDVSVGNNTIAFKADNVWFATRLLDGEYPDYTQMIQDDWKFKFIVNRNDFLVTMKRLNTVSTEVKIVFDSNNTNQVRCETYNLTDAKFGFAKEELVCRVEGHIPESNVPGYMAGQYPIGIVARQFVQALDAISCETVEVELLHNLTMITIRELDSYNVITIIAPCRLTNEHGKNL